MKSRMKYTPKSNEKFTFFPINVKTQNTAVLHFYNTSPIFAYNEKNKIHVLLELDII